MTGHTLTLLRRLVNAGRYVACGALMPAEPQPKVHRRRRRQARHGLDL